MFYSQDYIHRIGRTGRGDGNVGQALLFLRPEEEEFISILRSMNVNISQLEFEGDLKDTQTKVSPITKMEHLIDIGAYYAQKILMLLL